MRRRYHREMLRLALRSASPEWRAFLGKLALFPPGAEVDPYAIGRRLGLADNTVRFFVDELVEASALLIRSVPVAQQEAA